MANMAAVPAVAHAAAPDAPNKRQDDFDMVKLQKALKHDQKRSHASRNKVAKLTPAEIRSLNHSVGLSKTGSVRSIDNHSVHRLSSATPPLTPDTPNSTRRSQSQRRPSADLPTPPLSPDRERRGSASSSRHIHAPKPLSHTQAAHLANAASISRPSSQSSYRGVVTYRGNEITRNNSLTMLQHPSPQIVSNPLSQFSRPRQSIIASSTSPPKPGSDYQLAEDFISPVNAKERTRSVGAHDQGITRDHSPIRPSDSPVSMDEAEISGKKLHKQVEGPQRVPILHITPKTNDPAHDFMKQDEQNSPTAKQKSNWRRTLTGLSEPDSDVVRLRKEYRRRTLLSPRNGYCLHALHYNDTKPGEQPQLRDSLRDELPSAKTSVFRDDERNEATQETEFGQHPAVRPLSRDIQRPLTGDSDSSPTSSSRKGKEREVDTPGVTDSDSSSMTSSVPSYSRCTCCGRVQKPGGFESELSPVMENENLRTNFSLEVERMTAERRRRSSSITSDGPRKYIPIIPMEVGNETKQARIEPMRETRKETSPQTSAPAPAPESQPALVGVGVTKTGDVIGPSSTPLAIMPRRRVDPRVVRFASLHRTKEDKLEEEAQKNQDESASNLSPPPTIQRFGSLYGLRTESQRQQHQSQQQQEQQSQQQQQQQQQQITQNAYQPQQVRQQPRTNGYHPLRESHAAYHEVTLPRDEPQPGTNYAYSPVDGSVVEKPLGDSPTAKRSIPISPQSNFSSDDDGAEVVDLSSFDGSFIHHNMSRAPTVIRDASPPSTTSHDIHQNQDQHRDQNPAQNQIQDDNRSKNQIQTQSQTLTQTQAQAEPETEAELESQRTTPPLTTSNTSSLAIKTDNSSNSPSIPSTSATGRTGAPTPYSSASSSSDPTTQRQPPPLNTTIVRLVPSIPILSSGSSSPQLSGRNPMRLGDWVLPESPSTRSLGSRRGSLQGEQQLSGLAAA